MMGVMGGTGGTGRRRLSEVISSAEGNQNLRLTSVQY